MRYVTLLLILLASSSTAEAQQRFVNACVQSSEGEEALGEVEAQPICACAADRAQAQGISPSSLDGLTEYVGANGKLDLGLAPAPMQALGEIVVEGLFQCLFASIDDALATLELTPTPPGEPEARTTPPAQSAPMMRPSRPASEGGATRAGRGAVIRIRG